MSWAGTCTSYKIDVAALQETRCFGEDGIQSWGVCCGRPFPGAGVVRQRGEGVAIVLSGPAIIGAWKAGGSR